MAGRYTAYSVYKESDEKWIGKVPEHWDVQRLGQFFEERREKVSDKDYPPLSVTMNGIVPQLETAAKTDAGDNRKLVLKNDFVINSRSDRKGSSGVSTLDGSVSLISIVMKPREIRPSYVHHLLRSYPFQEEFYRFGKGIVADLWSTNASEMRNIKLPIPSQHEQEQIANFLDHETAKIDTLIDKQQQLIKLLQEKRQAVISHSVTKGLNPDAAMKDSGVEWLGEVPEHWVTPKIGYLCWVTKLTGFEYTNCWVPTDDGEIVALRGFNIGERFLSLEKTENITKLLSDKLSRSKLKAGDVVMPCTGTLGNAAVIECDDKFHINQNIAKLTFSEKVNPYFAVQWLTSSTFRTIVDFNNTSGMQPVLLIGDIRNMPFPLPPPHEQDKIIKYLDGSNAKYGQIIQRAELSLNLLEERRTALISAAVTGKIDVRNWQPTQAETIREASA